jgi:signal transduction histidine kinase
MGVMFWPGGRETRNMLLGLGGVFVLGAVAITLFRYNYYLNPSLPIFVLLLCYLGHLVSQWLWLTTKLVKQIRQLDKQLDEGLDKVFMTIPTSLVRKYNTPEKRKLTGGIDRHISRIHNGIEALALQNSFINHLLSKETPPLILWQQDNGVIVLANTGFVELWKNMSDINSPLPNLSEFYTLLVSKVVSDKNISQQPAFEKDLQLDRMVDVGLLVNGRKSYNRVLIHKVKGSILGFSGVLASFTDVTEIRELERIKGEVMNIVSHELKLPLTTIMGFAEMLSENLKGESKIFAEEICSQSKRLAKMIEDFLDIARIESGKYVINKYPFDLLTVVHDAASGVNHSAERKGVEIVYTLPAKITHLMGDEVLITQAILNLLDNAVKFSPARSKVFVKVSESETDIVLQVSDEGPGISGEEKKLVFEKFVRGGGQKNESGFGLGLSFVKQVVEGHGGTISVEDAEGGGARFIIILPKQQ